MHSHTNTPKIKITGTVNPRSVRSCGIQTDSTVMQAGLQAEGGYYRLFFGIDSNLYPTSQIEGGTVQIIGTASDGAVLVDEMKIVSIEA